MSFLSHLVDRVFASPGVQDWAQCLIVEGVWQHLNWVAALTLALLLCLLPSMWKLVKQVPRTVWLDVILLTVLGFVLRVFVSPHTPQVYMDEINYGGVASSLRESGRYVVAFQSPPSEKLMPFLPAWPFVLAWLGRILPTTFPWISAICVVLASASVPLAYAVAWALRPQRCFAVALAGLVATWPLHLRISGCSALENGSFTALLLLAFCLIEWNRRRSWPWLLASALTWVWFACWRMENGFVIFPVLVLSLWVALPGMGKLLFTGRACLCALVAIVLAWPSYLCDLYGVYNKFYLTDSQSVKVVGRIGAKFVNNLGFWISNDFHPILYTVLAVLAIALAWKKRLVWAGILWFVVLNAFFGLIPTADFSSSSSVDSWRNSLYPTFGLLILAAVALANIEEWLYESQQRWQRGLGIILAALVLTMPWAKNEYIQEQTWLMKEYALAQRIGTRLPPKAFLFVSHSQPYMIGLWRDATRRDWAEYVLPQESLGAPTAHNCPVLLQASNGWLNDRERLFILVATQPDSCDDGFRVDWFAQNYRLRQVDGELGHGNVYDYRLFEVDGLTKQARAWVTKAQTAK